jgi:bile acid:Na+ symporter, BASS family
MERRPRVAILSHFVHHHFIWFVVGSYAVAAFWPAPGLWIRGVSFAEITPLRETACITLPVLMLAFLLWNAGLGVQADQLRNLARRPRALLAGLIANLLIPIAFIFGVTHGMRFWHNPEELQTIVTGLALVAAMPIAGSAAAWSQNANGDLALSLGLVLSSTFLSPVTTPIALHAVGLMASGDYAQALHALASSGTGAFVAVSVVLPSFAGIAVRRAVGEARLASAGPLLKLVNSVNLLLLNYANGSVSLPQTVADPDWDFLAAVLGVVFSQCLIAFASGWLIARLVKADGAQRTSLMFGLGMANNGTGLVLASLALADHPRVLLPIIFYNLLQHLVAAGVDWSLCRTAPVPQRADAAKRDEKGKVLEPGAWHGPRSTSGT